MNHTIIGETNYINDEKEINIVSYWLHVTFFSIYTIFCIKFILYYSKKNEYEIGYALGIEPYCETEIKSDLGIKTDSETNSIINEKED
tara:strand:- start:7971 stop:8234 length:264 start_codon:yes stop_codon:yes gene_type:complete